MINDPVTDLSVSEHFRDDKARTSKGDVLGAVCLDSAEENACIDNVQRALTRIAMYRVIRIRRPSGVSVLDYGCGTGRWVDFLRGYGFRYTGVDLSAGLLTIAKRQHPNTEFRKVDGQSIPYGDAQFDVVWSIAVVHHNPPDRQEHLLAEFSRVIRSGGVLVLLEGTGRNSEAGLYYPRPRQDWTALAQRHGLSRRWRRGACYFIFRSIGEAVRRRAVATSTRTSRGAVSDARLLSPGTPAWIRFAARLDGMLCPRLAGLLPPPVHRRAIMVFEKASEHRGGA
jgi:SAM-dependent methyltransferase